MKQSAPRVRYAGFSLLEVLVALVILSVGLLGLARMQSTGLRQNNSAYFHSQATTLAYAILDRIRVNLDAAENGDYDIAIGTPRTASKDCETASNTCSTTEMADFDVNEWKSSLSSALPGGDGSISRSTSGTRVLVKVTVEWTDPTLDSANNPQTLTVDSEI